MNSKLIHLNLNEILDKGLAGELESMSKEDWLLLDSLINQSCKTNYEQGLQKGYRQGYREGEDSIEKVEPLPRSTTGFINLPHDDCEGNLMETLEVCLAQDGDVHLKTYNDSLRHLRFRNMIGGGKYPNTYIALRILYDSMVADSKGEHQDWGKAVKRYIGE